MKIWDLLKHTTPTLVWEQSSNLGAIQCLAVNPNNQFIFIAGGDNKAHNLQVIDLREIPIGMCINIFYMHSCWLLCIN